MKIAMTLLAATLACGAAFAQGGPGPNPKQEANPTQNRAAAKGEMNAQARGKDAGMSASASATMGHRAMDTNNDGFVSRKEWDAYHGTRWTGFKPNKEGMVPWAEVEKSMRYAAPN